MTELGRRQGGVLYSIVETCKRLDLNTHEYLADILTRLPSTLPAQIPSLTPTRWKAVRDAAATIASD